MAAGDGVTYRMQMALGAKVAKSLPQSVNKTKAMFDSLGKAGKKACELAATSAKIATAAIGAGAVAMATLTKKALDAAGELEQNVGGSEQVFGAYAAEMQKTASAAFDKMGLSASDYLATANKMGALFQGSGFGVEEAAKMSSEAMQRAADVASIMGIDVSAAMDAVANAAKGNFTMMDNLGVKIDDTAIKQYALAKKLKINTKAMTQQEKIGIAMEMFMEKSAYAAGNYARENDTLAGSLTTAKAAWSNFLSGAGDGKQLASALSNAAKVITKNITDIMPRLIEGVSGLIEGLSAELPSLMSALVPGLITGAITLIKGLAASIPQIISALGSAMPSLVTAIFGEGDVSDGIFATFGNIVTAISPHLDSIKSTITGFVATVKPKFDALFGNIVSLLPGIIGAFSGLVDALFPIITIIGDVFADLSVSLIPCISQLFITLANIAIPVISDIITAIQPVITGISSIVSQVISLLMPVISEVLSCIMPIFDALYPALESILSAVSGIIPPIVSIASSLLSLIMPIVSALTTIIAPLIDTLVPIIQIVTDVIGVLCEALVPIGQLIAQVVNIVIQLLTPIISIISQILAPLVEFLMSRIKAAIDVIKPIISIATTIMRAIVGVIQNIVNWISNISVSWQGIIDWISSNWQNIIALILNPFGTIFSWLYNNFEGFRNFVDGVVQSVAGFFLGLWDGICSGVTAAVEWITGAWDNIVTTIGDFVSDFGTAIAEAFKGVINTAISWVQDLINGFISGINLAIELINNLGVNIPLIAEVELPKLAKGGIATAPTIAMIGEGTEKEAVLPLSRLSALLEEARSEGGAGGDDTEQTVINFAPKIEIKGDADERTISEAMKISFEEFKKLMEMYERDRKRKSFAY